MGRRGPRPPQPGRGDGSIQLIIAQFKCRGMFGIIGSARLLNGVPPSGGVNSPDVFLAV